MVAKMRLGTLLTVKDMDRAVRFYSKTLGAKVTYRPRGRMRRFWASLELGGVPVWLVNPERREKRALAYNVLFVSNIRSTVAALRRRRVRFEAPERMNEETRIEGSIAFEAIGASAFFKDTEGNLLMLWQEP